jgi:NADH-quinone oxidoreductase subunit E
MTAKKSKKPQATKEPKESKTPKKAPKPKKPTIDTVLTKYQRHPQHLIALLQDVQVAFNYISPENLNLICDYLGVPITQAWSIATFYKSFSLEPRGEHEIKVCLGTACHLKGGERLVECCERDLEVTRGHTTGDQKFTLETVNCLGSCALAPVVMIDEDYLGGANIRTLKKRLEKK